MLCMMTIVTTTLAVTLYVHTHILELYTHGHIINTCANQVGSRTPVTNEEMKNSLSSCFKIFKCICGKIYTTAAVMVTFPLVK